MALVSWFLLETHLGSDLRFHTEPTLTTTLEITVTARTVCSPSYSTNQLRECLHVAAVYLANHGCHRHMLVWWDRSECVRPCWGRFTPVSSLIYKWDNVHLKALLILGKKGYFSISIEHAR